MVVLLFVVGCCWHLVFEKKDPHCQGVFISFVATFLLRFQQKEPKTLGVGNRWQDATFVEASWHGKQTRSIVQSISKSSQSSPINPHYLPRLGIKILYQFPNIKSLINQVFLIFPHQVRKALVRSFKISPTQTEKTLGMAAWFGLRSIYGIYLKLEFYQSNQVYQLERIDGDRHSQ